MNRGKIKEKLEVKTLFFIGAVFLFSSCMMMGPGYMAGSHQVTTDPDHSQGYYDPVCGNHIDTIQDELSWQYRGNVYYFHSEECMNNFKDNPESYLTIGTAPAFGNLFLWGMGGVIMTTMMIFMII